MAKQDALNFKVTTTQDRIVFENKSARTMRVEFLDGSGGYRTIEICPGVSTYIVEVTFKT